VADLLIALVVAAMANALRRRTLSRLLLAQRELRELSERCELTGLLNRRGFLDAAQRRMTRGGAVTLWFIDVDDLKQVNDQQGHDVGDLLLLCVATALEEVFPDAVVARLSGDEFAVVEDEASVRAQSARLAQLEQRLALPTTATGLPVQVSTGTATSEPGQDLSELLSAADAAMYRAKAAKRRRRTDPLPRVVIS
jgi:diguanylate cyclase (GGDEF)-like protein